ncbi:MAG: isocitrate dehydrogenase (NADP(+)) [Acidobacteriota bacterium]
MPQRGSRIEIDNGILAVPDDPIIPFIEGDGVGPDIWRAARRVFDAAVRICYGGKKSIEWMEVYAGEKAKKKYGEWLPRDTYAAVRYYRVAIKGPLTTPVGGGYRSLNVTLRQELDLYACVRPVRYFEGVPSPVRRPQDIDIVIFRENTEDVYAGIEWKKGSQEAKKIIDFVSRELACEISKDSGIGIKSISVSATQRLVRRAIQYAIDHGRSSVTLMHKGNIMKHTEGAFRDWGYAIAKKEFGSETVSESELASLPGGTVPGGKILIKDRIADSMFQQLLLRPREYSVVATPNLNGDYLSDAAVAQVGGLGLAPGGNIGDGLAFFEATHGTAPKYAGQDKVNPGSLILSGVMMFEHLGWKEVEERIVRGIKRTIQSKTVTYDLARQMEGAHQVRCSEFAEAIVRQMERA